jgi:hypothetical protein
LNASSSFSQPATSSRKTAYFALIPAIVALANPLKFFSKEGR